MVENLFDCVERSKKEEYDTSLLNHEFKRVLSELESSKKHLFITGKAGTGKSTLLKYFRDNTKKNVIVLAPTGLAALNVGGQTIHSFFRFPPSFIHSKSIKKVDNKLFKKIDAIIIDEVSMVRADLLDGIDKFMKKNGQSRNKPFGGVQLIFFGDLFQLPPVVAGDKLLLNSKYEVPYFFGADIFKNLNYEVIELENTYRQKDKHFIELLDNIRTGELDKKVLQELNKNVKPYFKPGDEYVTLTTTNKLARMINTEKLSRIKNKTYTYRARIEGEFKAGEKLPVNKELKLKVGAKVIFLRNDKEGKWVNGSIGVVSELSADVILVRLENGGVVKVDVAEWEKIKHTYDREKDRIVSEVKARITQYPLKLAWALTIHKSQGQTFNKVFIDLSTKAFAHGQTYVALSRCTTLNGIVLKSPISPRDVIVDERVMDFLNFEQKRINNY